MINIYFIGGSPCSGKSTVAEILSKKYDLNYFKVDDFLDKYTREGSAKGYSICKKQISMNAEETWMRDPMLQCREEIMFYKEIFEFILEDLAKIKTHRIISEGAAYLPSLMQKLNIPSNKYISLTSKKEFQVSHYKKREWVPYILSECRDKEQAFSNWMDRDALFAKEVQEQCLKTGYVSIINDGSIKPDELAEKIATYLQLNTGD